MLLRHWAVVKTNYFTGHWARAVGSAHPTVLLASCLSSDDQKSVVGDRWS